MTFTLKSEDQVETVRTLDLGMGVWLKIRWDARSAWDIVNHVLRSPNPAEPDVNLYLRLAAEYGLDWNVLDEDGQPVPFSPPMFAMAVNQEPGLMLAFYIELTTLAREGWYLEKKAYVRSQSGMSPQGSADTADDAQKLNSHAPEAYVGQTASSAPTGDTSL